MVPADRNFSAEVSAPLPVGTKVHDHVIEKWLRAVPDGHVYSVVQARTGAVATLHEYLPMAWAFRDADGVMAQPGRGREFQVGLRRYLLRARQLRELEHPSLPRLIEAWPSHGTACILTSPVASRTLADVVTEAGGRVSLVQAWPWLCACCDLAEWLHQQGKIHGAWDPETIGVSDDGSLVLAMPEVDGPAHPATPWMPLEQTALAPKGVQRGPWTDVFGISGLAAYMLTGQSPVTARRRPVVSASSAAAPAPAPRQSSPTETLPRAMMAAIRVSLLPNARQRPQDITQLKTMMGLFATAPVLSDELKPVARATAKTGTRPTMSMPRTSGAAADSSTATPSQLPGESRFGDLTGRDTVPGALNSEPMGLQPKIQGPGSPVRAQPKHEPRQSALRDGNSRFFPSRQDYPGWDEDEALQQPPPRRRLTAGAVAVCAALAAVAGVWLVLDAPSPSGSSGNLAAADRLHAQDLDRILKSAPPAAGSQPVPVPVAPAVVPKTLPPVVAVAPTVVPSQPIPAPTPAVQPERAAPQPSPAVESATVSPSTPSKPQDMLPSTAAPTVTRGEAAAKPVVPNPPRTAPAGTVESVPIARAPAARSPAPARTGPTCSQLLLEQSLGAPVSASDLRNCR